MVKTNLVEYRAQALAEVFLTRRKDVAVMPFRHGDLDFFASISPTDANDVKGLMGLGVIAWGTDKPLDSERKATRYANERWTRKGPDDAENEKPIFFLPVIVLLFSMHNDDGYYAWITEPSIEDESESVKLNVADELVCTKLDRQTLDRIVAKVKGWYRSLSSMLVAPYR